MGCPLSACYFTKFKTMSVSQKGDAGEDDPANTPPQPGASTAEVLDYLTQRDDGLAWPSFSPACSTGTPNCG